MNSNTVTEEQVRENMKDVIVRTVEDFGKPTTYVVVRMKNGFTLRESTTCVDPANYNEEIGKKICLEKIEDKVWFLLGYALQEKIANEPKDYRERMALEYAELNDRTKKLDMLFASDSFKDMQAEKKKLMKLQYEAMAEYREALRKRCEQEGVEI